MTAAKRRYGYSRRDLATAAIRQFQERGFAVTTVEDVAEAAGYAPRTFFRQFATKEDVVFFDWPDILSPLQKVLDHASSSAWDTVCAIILKNSDNWVAADPELALNRTRLIHDEPALYRRHLEICSEWESVIVKIFAAERGVDPLSDTYSQVIATCIMGACRSALRQWSVDPATSLREHASAGLRLIQSAFGLNAPESP